MLDIGFMEILVLGAVALIVVGPKDLPGLLRTVGQFAGKARGMAREFQRSMEDAAREADLGDVADAVKGKGNLNNLPFDNQIVDSLKDFEKTVKSETTDAMRAADSSASPSSPSPSTATAKPAATGAPSATASAATKPDAPKVDAPKTPAPAAPTTDPDPAPSAEAKSA